MALVAFACATQRPRPRVDDSAPVHPVSAPTPTSASVPVPVPVSVATEPASATLEISCRNDIACRIAHLDGDATEVVGPLSLPPGRHQLTIVAAGYQARSMVVDLEPSERRRLVVDLDPLPVRVRFATEPAAIEVRVDGADPVAVTPGSELAMSAGRHRLELVDPSGRCFTEARFIDGRPGEYLTLEAVLKPKPASLCLSSDRPWQILEVDGEKRRRQPDGCIRLSAGKRRIVATADRHRAWLEVVVGAGERATATLDWRRYAPDRARYAYIAAGLASLGSERYAELNPPRAEHLRGFWIARREVTVEAYRRCVERGACSQPARGADCTYDQAGRSQHPVNCVSPRQAERYARFRSRMDGLRYRLPTVAQWEWSARGASQDRFPWGDAGQLERCNTCGAACPRRWRVPSRSDGWSTTAPAGALERCRGSLEIYDLVGNVAEWCRRDADSDTFDVRGGSWAQPDAFCDPAYPGSRPSDHRHATIGFRLVVVEISPPWSQP